MTYFTWIWNNPITRALSGILAALVGLKLILWMASRAATKQERKRIEQEGAEAILKRRERNNEILQRTNDIRRDGGAPYSDGVSDDVASTIFTDR